MPNDSRDFSLANPRRRRVREKIRRIFFARTRRSTAYPDAHRHTADALPPLRARSHRSARRSQEMPISSMFYQRAALAQKRLLCVAKAERGPPTSRRRPENNRLGTSAADKRVEDTLFFLLCCSNRIAVLCDSRRHFDDRHLSRSGGWYGEKGNHREGQEACSQEDGSKEARSQEDGSEDDC
ncbi:MAG: hypothetical protein R3D62_12120 [Xanthobacteraceae bacterium]